MRRLSGLALNLTAMFVSLGLGLLVAEGVVRAFHLVPVNDYRRIADRGVPWRMRPGATMIESQPEFRVSVAINEAGFRDREFTLRRTPGRVRIALIGDSFTFGTGVELEARASNLLESKLRSEGLDCEVYNFGMAGLDTYGAVEVLRRSVAGYRPDWAVLMFYLGNDVTDNVRREQARSASAPRGGAAARVGFVSRAARWLASHSQLYEFVMTRVASFPALRSVYNRLKAANLVGEVVDQLDILTVSRSGEARLWNPTRAALRTFVGFAREHGMRPLIVFVPSRLQYDDAVWTGLVSSRHLDPSAYSRNQPNRILGEFVTGELHGEVLDPLGGFQATGAAAGSTYYPINGHFTARGHELLAELLTRFFERRLAARGARAPARAG